MTVISGDKTGEGIEGTEPLILPRFQTPLEWFIEYNAGRTPDPVMLAMVTAASNRFTETIGLFGFSALANIELLMEAAATTQATYMGVTGWGSTTILQLYSQTMDQWKSAMLGETLKSEPS